jgi:preprotein translocase subunit SecG
MSLLTVVIIVSMLLTVVVLVTGIGSMGVGGKFDEKHSEQLMFARVGLQGVTLLLLFFAIYLANI